MLVFDNFSAFIGNKGKEELNEQLEILIVICYFHAHDCGIKPLVFRIFHSQNHVGESNAGRENTQIGRAHV